MSNTKPNWVFSSRAYKKAAGLVSDITQSPKRLLELVSKGQHKIGRQKNGKLTGLVGSINTAFRLLKSYANGNYRDISLESLALIVASLVYFVMPVDALPDFIIALGLTDDAALLAWTFRSLSDELQRFSTWEKEQHPANVKTDTARVINGEVVSDNSINNEKND